MLWAHPPCHLARHQRVSALPAPALQLEGLYRLTDHSLQHLPLLTPRIATLNVRMCNCLSAEALLRMVLGQQVTDTEAPGNGLNGGEIEGAKVTTEEGMEGMHQVGLPSSVRPDGGLPVMKGGCSRLHSLQLGGVMGEAETTRLVRCIKEHRPTMFMRL